MIGLGEIMMNPYTYKSRSIDRSREIFFCFSSFCSHRETRFVHSSIVSIILICSICLEHRESVYLFSSLSYEDNGHGMCLYVSSFFHTFTLISEEKLDNYQIPFDLTFDHSLSHISSFKIKHRISSLHFKLTFTDDDHRTTDLQ